MITIMEEISMLIRHSIQIMMILLFQFRLPLQIFDKHLRAPPLHDINYRLRFKRKIINIPDVVNILEKFIFAHTYIMHCLLGYKQPLVDIFPPPSSTNEKAKSKRQRNDQIYESTFFLVGWKALFGFITNSSFLLHNSFLYCLLSHHAKVLTSSCTFHLPVPLREAKEKQKL